MKIKIESSKIVKALKKLNGIEVVLENASDAKEAIDLILSKNELFENKENQKLKDVKVTSLQEYESSAVDYKLMFLMEFLFEEGVPMETKIGLIKSLQELFAKL